MRLESARDLKQEILASEHHDKLLHHRRERWMANVTHGLASASSEPRTSGIAVGICRNGEKGYAIALRLQTTASEAQMEVERISAAACHEVDVSFLGRVQAQHSPLTSGSSVAHRRVGAGTLGAFVVVEDNPLLHFLSNNHVLADCNQASIDDEILHPSPIDGGQIGTDRVGALAAFVELLPADQLNTVDAALCRVDEDIPSDPRIGGVLPGGPIDPEPDEPVEKTGRTTGRTTGRITVIESDNLEIDYGPLGRLVFHGQIQVGTEDGTRFSDEGDSGSLVSTIGSREAIGLLFAGARSPGSKGYETVVNPLTMVLDRLGARLVA
ncbi:hypothetical protein [Streptomyces sp. NPDC004284]|uniref:hypothetical protein n=1 Tax=Streptomyces sp. NPDC004284 TaxID=3364695 RepID=UPI0036916B99